MELSVFLLPLYLLLYSAVQPSTVSSSDTPDSDKLFSTLTVNLYKAKSGDFSAFLDEDAVNPECIQSMEEAANSSGRLGAMLDAWGKPGAGILQGNVFIYGSYDECGSLEDVNYCLVDIPLVSAINITFMIAACVPAKCNESDVVSIMDSLLGGLGSSLPVSATCPALRQEFSVGAIVTILLLCFFAVLVLIGTLFDVLLRSKQCKDADKETRVDRSDNKQHSERQESRKSPHRVDSADDEPLPPNGNPLDDDEPALLAKNIADIEKQEQQPLVSKRDASHKKHQRTSPVKRLLTLLEDMLMSFSLYKTVPAILSTKQPASAINCINGIRVLSMFWVIGAHTNLWFFSSFMLDNFGEVISNIAPEFSYQGILNGFFAVDSFFFLSGLLVCYLTMREMSRRASKRGTKLNVFPFLTYYLHRILRLTPSYVVLIVIVSQLLPSLGNGPRYVDTVEVLAEPCSNYWWTNLLYINNFYPASLVDGCASWTWYLANDMQFYVISPLMLIPLYFCGPVGIIVTVFLLVGSLSATGIIAGVNNVGVNSLQGLLEPEYSSVYGDYGRLIYTKPYARIAPYLVGIVVGYVVYKGYKLPFKRIVNTAIYNAMMIFAAGVIAAVVYGTIGIAQHHFYTVPETVAYNTLSRLAWGIALGLIVLACHHNYGWWVDRFLSWPFWIPLSRLTYLAYLIHPVVLYLAINALRVPVHFSNVTVAVYMVGCTVLAYGMAAVLAILVEFPFSNMETAAFKLFGSSARKRKEVAPNSPAAN